MLNFYLLNNKKLKSKAPKNLLHPLNPLTFMILYLKKIFKLNIIMNPNYVNGKKQLIDAYPLASQFQ